MIIETLKWQVAIRIGEQEKKKNSNDFFGAKYLNKALRKNYH